VDELRKILLVWDGGDRQTLASALAIKDSAEQARQKVENLIQRKTWEFFEFFQTKKFVSKTRAVRKVKKAKNMADEPGDDDVLEESQETFGRMLERLEIAAGRAHEEAKELVDDLLGCPGCEELQEDCEDLEDALSDLRCRYCEILCEVDFLEGGEQPAFLLDLRSDLANIGVSIEFALWESGKICLQKKSYSARILPVLTKVTGEVKAIQAAITKWSSDRLDAGLPYSAATSDIAAQLQKLTNAVSRLGVSETCESLRSLTPLVDAVSQSLSTLYGKKLDNFDKTVFFQPWSLLVQVRCILDPCCDADDECDDLKSKLSKFFCLWQDLNGQFKDANCAELFEGDGKKDCCCTSAAAGSTTSATVASAASSPVLSAAQVNAALQQFQQVVTQAKTQSLLSQSQVDELNKILPSGAGTQSQAAPLALARYAAALKVYLAQAADQAASQCVSIPSSQQGQLATLQYQLGQALQVVQGSN
jgi:hypothetical protein